MSRRFIVFIFFSMFLFPPLLPAGEVWKITTLNWEPYSSANMATQGNSIQRLRYLLAKQDIQLLVDFLPWKRAQLEAEETEYIGYFRPGLKRLKLVS